MPLFAKCLRNGGCSNLNHVSIYTPSSRSTAPTRPCRTVIPMFDECKHEQFNRGISYNAYRIYSTDVEHASHPPALSPPSRSLPQLQYEGFENPQYADEIPVDVGLDYAAVRLVLLDSSIAPIPLSLTFTSTQLETGYVANLAQPDYEPIFELAGVQHTLPAPLVSLTVSSNILTMAFKSNTLQQLSLKDSDKISNITLAKKGDVTVSKIFSDPTGRHVIIATHQGENFYLHEGWQKARPLPKCKLVIESVAWNPSLSSPSSAHPRTSTREILLGGLNGTIYEMLLDAHDDIFKTPDRYVSPVYTLPDRQPITGIHAEYLAGGKRLVVLATSVSRIYQFVGNIDRRPDEVGKLFDPVFLPYRESAPSESPAFHRFAHSYHTACRVLGTAWRH